MINNGLFTSEKKDWRTPSALVKDLATVFKWNLDVCASEPNVCQRFFNSAQNGLVQEWTGLCWMNPPYGRQIGRWMAKALESSLMGATIVCLPPARTDTRWWHATVPKAQLVVFIKGRLHFNDAGSAPFPSAFVVFGELNPLQRQTLCSYGWAPHSQKA